MRPCTPQRLLFPLALLISSVFAIFSDEAYQIDFHHALLGLPQAHTTFLHRPSAGSTASLLYTFTENGILGAVNPKDGAVLWRQRLGEEGQIYKGKGLLKAGSGSNIVASAVDGKVQVWDAVDGRLGWKWQTRGSVKAVDVVPQEGASLVVVAYHEGTNGYVRCFSADTGTVQWQFKDPSGDTPYSLISTEGRLFYLALHAAMLKGLKIRATELHLSDGSQKAQPYSFASENEVTAEASILFAGVTGGLPVIAWSDKTFKTVKVGSLFHSQTTTLGLKQSGGQNIEGVKVHASAGPLGNSHLLFHFQEFESHWAYVYEINASHGKGSELYEVEKATGKGAFSASSHGSNVYFVHHTSSEVSLTSSRATPLQIWRMPSKPGADTTELRAISHVVSEVASRGSSKFSVRSVLALVSGDWEMVRNGESSWIKHEGITGVVAAAFADISREEFLAQTLGTEGQSNVVSAYLHRVKRHVNDLKSLPPWLKQQYELWSEAITGSEKSFRQLATHGEKFGFRKFIIVATKHGIVAALDTGQNGKVVWSIPAASPESGTIWSVRGIEIEADTVVVRASEGEYVRVKISTGRIVSRQEAGLVESLSNTIPVPNGHGQHVLLPIKTDGSLGPTSNTGFADDVVIVTENEGHRLTGWTLSREQEPTVAWQFRPPPGYTVREIVHRPAHDPVASIGKVLGDRNVLYKYLNPNLVLVTLEDKAASSVSFFLLDSVSGDVLHSIDNSGVDLAQPTSSTVSENLFVYTLFSKSFSRDPSQAEPSELSGYQLSVSELYESPFPNDRGSLGATSNSSTRQPLVSDDDSTPSPHVISQTFLVPEAISQLSFTSTLQSITPRSLLCLTPLSNSIVSIPRHFLEPRRPVGRDPTSAEMEEGLFRYNAILEFDPKWYLNHKRESLGFSNVISSPSRLESTSLIFAYGDVDLFGTRVSPIGSFDMLGKGFSKVQLVATVVVLAIGTGFLAPLARKKQVDGTYRA